MVRNAGFVRCEDFNWDIDGMKWRSGTHTECPLMARKNLQTQFPVVDWKTNRVILSIMCPI